jgi:ubiquitin carboxyl-terminal hydrolase 25/28
MHILQTELKALKHSVVDLDGPSAVAQTAEYLISLDEVNRELNLAGIEPVAADGDITGVLISEAEEQAARVSELERDITTLEKKLKAQFEDLKNFKYRLAAVFIHRGSSAYGHYWIYIRDFSNNTWRKYNDETVEQWTDLSTIYEAKTWEHGTPTYAVYVAEDKLNHYIDPVCRDPEPEPEFSGTDMPPMDWTVEEIDKAPPYKPSPGIPIAPKLETEGSKLDWDEVRQVAPPPNGW